MKFNWRNAAFMLGLLLGFYTLVAGYVALGLLWSPWVFVAGGIALVLWTTYQAGREP